MKKIIIPVVCALLIIGVLFVYNKITIFSIQPIGAIPKGVTAVMWRKDDMKFFDSPDSLCLRKIGYVSLLCRSQAMIQFVDTDKVIFKLPYIEQAYLLSTGGKKFEK